MTRQQLAKRVIDRVNQDFEPKDCDQVISLLAKYDDLEIERVQLAILGLAKGDKNFVQRAIYRAIEDYRDILQAFDHGPNV
ncbi:MAG: hypothetical protein GY796_31580 [Chloroflexi bacterium]|nr:hypothetical protein [Chloroflexota bacterium]